MRTRAGLLVFFPMLIAVTGVAGCSPARPKNVTDDPLTPETASGSSSSMAPSGVPRACLHDTKDLAPCSEDCDRGIAFACTVMAGRIERGDGVAKDLTRAIHLHERACELRDTSSCITASRMHASGSGVPPSRAKQIELLATACKLGDGTACAVPAKAFTNGTGVARDERRAADLWQHGCAAGIASACEAIEPEAH